MENEVERAAKTRGGWSLRIRRTPRGTPTWFGVSRGWSFLGITYVWIGPVLLIATRPVDLGAA
jgi:hypothetical protein